MTGQPVSRGCRVGLLLIWAGVCNALSGGRLSGLWWLLLAGAAVYEATAWARWERARRQRGGMRSRGVRRYPSATSLRV